jgi:hypothetical protein
METTKKSTKKNGSQYAYVLQLEGDVSMGSGVTLEVAMVSLDRATVEAMKVRKDAELLAHFDGEPEGEHMEEDGGEPCEWSGTELSTRPYWAIVEYPLY